MPVEERALEVRGDDVETAVEKGLAELGLQRSAVTVEVVDEGSSGFLGLGGRDAIVRLVVTGAGEVASEVGEAAESAETAERPETPGEVEEVLEEDVALGIVRGLLERMKVEANSSIHYTEPDELTGERRPVVDVQGEDMGILIGSRGETLNALQFVARLMAGHALRRRPLFIVDVAGYRARREQALTRLAQRMAEKAVRKGRPINLEPMPANERRIIHITLRDHQRVYTESAGEGKRRKVRILLK